MVLEKNDMTGPPHTVQRRIITDGEQKETLTNIIKINKKLQYFYTHMNRKKI